jgi:allene oxide cyclase
MHALRKILITASLALFNPATFAGQHFEFIDSGTDVLTDLGAPGDSVGDILTYDNRVEEVGGKKLVGHEQGFCIRVVAGKSWECLFTIVMPDGQMTLHGPWLDKGTSVFSVTGGSGKYANARGALTMRTRGTEPETWAYSIDLE